MIPRRRKPIPAALHAGVMRQLGPLDPLRLRFVADEPDVRFALAQVRAANAERVRALKASVSSPEAARAHEQALQVHRQMVQDVLRPAVLAAEARRARILATMPPDAAALATAAGAERMVAWAKDPGGVILLADRLLRRKAGAWVMDPAAWAAPEVAPYLTKTLSTEVKYGEIKRAEKKARRRAVDERYAPAHRIKEGTRVLRRIAKPNHDRGPGERGGWAPAGAP